MAEMADGEMNDEELTANRTVVFLSCVEFSAEEPNRAWSITDDLVEDDTHCDDDCVCGEGKGCVGAGKLRVVVDSRDFLDVMNASSCRISPTGRALVCLIGQSIRAP